MAGPAPHERENVAPMLTDQRGYAATDIAAADPPRRHKSRDAATS
jgi:hypothetical protein